MLAAHPTDSPVLPILSVCLPTYNRAALLREALKALADQGGADLFEAIEVLVSDNASADDTSEVVQAIIDRYPFIRLHYVRHPENIGMDRNLYGVVQRAAGEFVLVVSDDDVLLPGALATLLAAIGAHDDLDAICLNMRTFQTDPCQESPAILALDQDTTLPERDACLSLFGTWITFLSIVAFRRSALRQEGYEEYIGTYFILSYLFLDALRRGALVLHQPFLAVRDNYVGGYSFFEVFVTRFQHLLQAAEQRGFSRTVTRRVFSQHLRSFLYPFLLTFKCRSSAASAMNYRDGVKRLLRAYPGEPFLLVVLPLLLAPAPLLRAAYAARQSLKTKS